MSLEIKVPPVGESITEVTLSRWIKQDGDAVEMDEIIAELESDKATFELTAESAGTLKTVAAEGDTLPIGGVVATIEAAGAAPAAAPAVDKSTAAAADESAPGQRAAKPEAAAAEQAPAATEAKTIEIKVPPVGESITEVTLSRWIKKDGDQVEMDEAIAELESDKATFELTAESAGTLKTVAAEGDTLAIGAVVCSITGGGAAAASSQPSAPSQESAQSSTPNSGPQTSGSSYAAGTPSPAAGKILAEKGMSPEAVNGTGVGGRITKEDALGAQKTAAAAPASKPAAAPPSFK